MSIEYIASISEAEYKMFRIVMTTELPDDYQMWLRVRERGKLTALTEHGTSVTEIEVSLVEFAAYAKGLKNPNFSIGALDQCARRKAMAKAQAPAASQGGLATQSINAPSRRQLDSNDARSNAGRSRGDNNHHSTQAAFEPIKPGASGKIALSAALTHDLSVVGPEVQRAPHLASWSAGLAKDAPPRALVIGDRRSPHGCHQAF